jgi:hypothetical protein
MTKEYTSDLQRLFLEIEQHWRSLCRSDPMPMRPLYPTNGGKQRKTGKKRKNFL